MNVFSRQEYLTYECGRLALRWKATTQNNPCKAIRVLLAALPPHKIM